MLKNRKLSAAIADASWSELVRQLEYKRLWSGRTLVKIDRWFPSSKRCGKCGHVVDKLPLDIREWDCPECGTHHDRDINAAQNILAAGLAVLPMGKAPSVIVCGASDLMGISLSWELRNTCKGKDTVGESVTNSPTKVLHSQRAMTNQGFEFL
jgi:transposase